MSFKEWTGGDSYLFDKRGGIKEIMYSKDRAFTRDRFGRKYCNDMEVRVFYINCLKDDSLYYPNRDSDYIKVLTQFL